MTKKLELITFGAGCFWGVEAAFQHQKGVFQTVVGYMGGHIKNPSYEEVCTSKTGHAEVVQISYDPDIISFDELLEIYWNVHDPTQKNKQGFDIGHQYRSVIFYHTDAQRILAESSIKKIQINRFKNKRIVTEIKPASCFYPAEAYHQHYIEKQRF
jgi:peptide-methionine (S)-S-oxide reductase